MNVDFLHCRNFSLRLYPDTSLFCEPHQIPNVLISCNPQRFPTLPSFFLCAPALFRDRMSVSGVQRRVSSESAGAGPLVLRCLGAGRSRGAAPGGRPSLKHAGNELPRAAQTGLSGTRHLRHRRRRQRHSEDGTPRPAPAQQFTKQNMARTSLR